MRYAGKLKTGNGLWKPKSEPAPNRTSESESPGFCRPGWHASVSERLKPRNYYLFALLIDRQNCSDIDCFTGIRWRFCWFYRFLWNAQNESWFVPTEPKPNRHPSRRVWRGGSPEWSAQARVGSAREWDTLGVRRGSVVPSPVSPGSFFGDGSSGASPCVDLPSC